VNSIACLSEQPDLLGEEDPRQFVELASILGGLDNTLAEEIPLPEKRYTGPPFAQAA
jgi:hypothetical protein